MNGLLCRSAQSVTLSIHFFVHCLFDKLEISSVSSCCSLWRYTMAVCAPQQKKSTHAPVMNDLLQAVSLGWSKAACQLTN